MRKTLLLIIATLLSGCASKSARHSYKYDSSVAFDNQASTTNNEQQTTNPGGRPIARRVEVPADPPVLFKPTVNLSIYHLRVPLGTVSASEDFWKRVDEHALDVSTYDVLYKNGIRVGLASMADLDR